jgi:hypothetical protein
VTAIGQADDRARVEAAARWLDVETDSRVAPAPRMTPVGDDGGR